MATIEQKINSLFSEEEPTEKQMEHLMSRIHVRYHEASVRFSRALALLVTVWMLAFLVGAGLVVEGNLVTFKLTKVKELLVAAPVLLGIASYQMINSYCSILIAGNALGVLYKKYWPKLCLADLETLCFPHTLVDQESLLIVLAPKGWARALTVVTASAWMVGTALLLGFVGLVHVSVLMVRVTGNPFWLDVLAVTAGTVVLLKSLLSLWIAGDINK